MVHNNIEELLNRYFSGESLPDEERLVADFIKESDGNMKIFREYERLWKESHNISNSREDAFSRLNTTIKHRRMYRNSIRITAVFAVIFCASAILFRDTLRPATENLQAETTFMAETGPMERTRLTLPDGTLVWVNSSSRISYCEDASSRNVHLVGEAYFDVVKDAGRPFTVELGNHTITVKGTKFNVTSYEKESRISAALFEGSIEFSSDMETVTMIPGELLEYECKSGVLHKTKTDLSSYTSWREGKIDCSSMHFSQFLTRLESIYGVTIEYDGEKYSSKCLSVIINTSEPVNNILDAVSSLLPVKCINKEGKYIITEN